jgi:5-methylcytosine-specific restriction enzyme B
LSFTQNGEVWKPVMDPNNMYDYFRDKQFFFSKEILTRYYLSLKTKPFVILTGISGTGKTKIAQVFADYVCRDDSDEDKLDRIAFVPVRPDWMDNKGILGYYNILDETYHTTQFLDLILAAAQHPEKPYFIILDEMNLAKVEHYFSDFLSILESRTPDNPRGMSMVLHAFEKKETPDGKEVPGSLHIPSNVFFTGTVNVDESTYMFSPKVLDRANVIEFNDVDLKQYAGGAATSRSSHMILADENVRDALDNRSSFCSKTDFDTFNQIDHGSEILGELLEILQKYNMHFGYRVINEISRFVNLCRSEVQQFDLHTSLDVQILQKILPKMHGTRARLEQPLTDLLSFCNQGGTRFPRSAQKISRILDQLSIQGYASFIE